MWTPGAVKGRCGPVVIMELLRNHDSEGPHLLMSSSLIDAVRTYLPAEVDLPACLDAGQQRDLVAALAAVPDPRRRRGVRYRLASLLAVAVCAVLAGACTFAAIADWVADLDPPARARLGLAGRVPAASTVWRFLVRLDATVLQAVLTGWLRARLCAAAAAPVVSGRAGRVVIAVDGKVLRAARLPEGRQVHLLSAYDTATGIVLAQVTIEAKSNEIPAFAPLLAQVKARLGCLAGTLITADALHTQVGHAHTVAAAGGHLMVQVKANQCATRRSGTSPLQAGQTRREVCWVGWLTWSREVKGTRACQETGGRVQVPGTARRATRVVWRRLDCLNPNLQRQHFTATGTAPGTGARRGWGVLVRPGQPSRRERCPARVFKEMSGAPAAALTCVGDERGSTVPVRLAVSECL
jgi:hypothetical protein